MSLRFFIFAALWLLGPGLAATPTPTDSPGPSQTRTVTLTPTPTPVPTASCAGGLTAGNSTPLGFGATASNNTIFFVPFTAPAGGESSLLRVFVNSAAGGDARAALYGGTSSPQNLLAQSGSQALADGWNSFSLGSAAAISGGSPYWVGVMYSSSSTAVNREPAPGNCWYRTFGYGPFPALASASLAGFTWSGFAEICPALSPTESPTPSRSATFTPALSPTPTATESPTFSASPSFSASPTASDTFTRSPTGTATPTRSPTAGPAASCPGGVMAGNSNPLGSYVTGAQNNIFFVPFTASMSGESAQVKVYLNSGGGGSARAALYSGAGSPGGLLAQSASQALADGWNSFSLDSAVAISGGGQYWIAVMYSSAATAVNRDPVPGGCWVRSAFAYGNFPALAGAGTSNFTWSGVTEICPVLTLTPSPSSTLSGTLTPELSPTPSPTESPTFSASPSFSVSPTISPSRSPSLTRTPTSTVTPTAVPTASCPGGLTAGNSSVLGSSITGAMDVIFFVPFTAPISGQTAAVKAYVTLGGGGGARGALYDGLSFPENLLAESGPQTLANGWNTYSLGTPVAVTGGGRYWVAVIYSSPATAINRDTVPGNCWFRAMAYGPFPALAGASAAGHTWTGFAEICPIVTATPTPTSTEILSPTGTASQTLSPTVSPSFTASFSPSATSTPTQSRTHSPTSSATPSATLTATATLSATSTEVHSPSPTPSATPSLTVSPSFSPSPTSTDSFTPGPSPTSTPTATPSASPTNSPTGSWTPSATPSRTVTPTATFSPTPSSSATATPALTPTPGSSATPTSTPTPTATDSPAPLPSATLSPSPSPPATPTSVASPTSSATASATPDASPSATPAVVSTLTRTPNLGVGRPRVMRAAALPNPQSGPLLRLAAELEGPADSLLIEAYSTGMALVFRTQVRGPFYAGWNALSCPSKGLSNGLYFVKVRGKLDGRAAEEGGMATLYWRN